MNLTLQDPSALVNRLRSRSRALTFAPMLDVKPKPRTATPPAKAWRNFYRVYRIMNLFPLGTVFPGIHGGPSIFPSKEIAEQHALTFLADLNPPGYSIIMDHVGAYPEGERAN